MTYASTPNVPFSILFSHLKEFTKSIFSGSVEESISAINISDALRRFVMPIMF